MTNDNGRGAPGTPTGAGEKRIMILGTGAIAHRHAEHFGSRQHARPVEHIVEQRVAAACEFLRRGAVDRRIENENREAAREHLIEKITEKAGANHPYWSTYQRMPERRDSLRELAEDAEAAFELDDIGGLDDETVEIVRQAALMHDIGKIGCVMNLNKPGKLSQEEYDVFKRHPDFGRDILEPISFLHPLIPGVHLHHERWDGSGYPLGLEAQEIPVIARIISVADTYDAMTSDRAYRKALPHEVAVSEIKRCSKSQFDPDVAHPFVEGIEEHRVHIVGHGGRVPE